MTPIDGGHLALARSTHPLRAARLPFPDRDEHEAAEQREEAPVGPVPPAYGTFVPGKRRKTIDASP